jgi:hypothetical protein
MTRLPIVDFATMEKVILSWVIDLSPDRFVRLLEK